MAMHKSAKTRIRRNARRKVINTARTSQTRSAIRKVEAAIAGGKYAEAQAALKDAQPVLHRGADKGVLRKKTASRKLSRLSARIKKLKK